MGTMYAFALSCLAFVLSAGEGSPYAIALHGGAGRILPAEMPAEVANAYKTRLLTALETGRAVLRQGGSAVGAVTAAIVSMEDDPAFNAGRGSVLTAAGTVEMDASIMAGDGRRAGAVAGVRTIRNPILAAAKVMTNSPHVLLVSDGAESFAKECGLAMVENQWFIAPHQRRRQ